MSKGHAKHHERNHGLSQFGKDLVRRSGSKCELCETAGVKLVVFEVPPIGPEPDFDHCIMICDSCREQIEKPKTIEADYWHFLASSMWSPVSPAKVISVAMLHHIAKDHRWAMELLDQVYLEPDEDSWISQIQI